MGKVMPKRLAQEVSRQCLLAIVSEDYPAGSALPPENDLAAEYGVSRVVVHEAIQILNAKGVLDVRQGRQATVNPIEQWDPLDTDILLSLFEAGKLGPLAHDLVEIRKILEVEAAGVAAEKASEEDIARLVDVCDRLISNSGDPVAYYELEDELHRQVWKASYNVLLVHMLRTMNHVFRFAKMMASRSHLPDRDIHHRALAQAIQRRDVAAAREAMRHDISRFDDELRIALQDGFKNGIGDLTTWQ